MTAAQPDRAPVVPGFRKRAALLRTPGTVAVIAYQGCLRRVAECACCGRERPLYARGMCQSCYSMRLEDGTYASYGYTQADRMEEFARLRCYGYTVAAAGERVGVSRRTAERYEASFKAAGGAPWRWRDPKPGTNDGLPREHQHVA